MSLWLALINGKNVFVWDKHQCNGFVAIPGEVWTFWHIIIAMMQWTLFQHFIIV